MALATPARLKYIQKQLTKTVFAKQIKRTQQTILVIKRITHSVLTNATEILPTNRKASMHIL